jgi:hypothetical protein
VGTRGGGKTDRGQKTYLHPVQTVVHTVVQVFKTHTFTAGHDTLAFESIPASEECENRKEERGKHDVVSALADGLQEDDVDT